jgi:hypothetical protein
MSDAAYSLAFLNSIAGLATRLAVDRLAIYSLRYDYGAFGSWELTAGRRASRVRVVWDGKEGRLSAFAASVGQGGEAPDWRPVTERDFSKKRTEHAEIFGVVHSTIRQYADG